VQKAQIKFNELQEEWPDNMLNELINVMLENKQEFIEKWHASTLEVVKDKEELVEEGFSKIAEYEEE
jgi:hypothetical protein